jgi:hypothetical protein
MIGIFSENCLVRLFLSICLGLWSTIIDRIITLLCILHWPLRLRSLCYLLIQSPLSCCIFWSFRNLQSCLFTRSFSLLSERLQIKLVYPKTIYSCWKVNPSGNRLSTTWYRTLNDEGYQKLESDRQRKTHLLTSLFQGNSLLSIFFILTLTILVERLDCPKV